MKKVVIFDVDNVLIKGQTQKILLHFLFKKRKIGFLSFIKIYFWFILYKLNLVKDTIRIRKKAFELMTDWDEAETKKLFKEFFKKEIKPHIFKKSINIIKSYINQGYEIILVSASLSEIVNELKEYLSLRFAISTKLEIRNKKYTGRISGSVPYGENKINEIKNIILNNNLTLEESYGYTDHYSDLPILKLVKNPVAINPDRKLRKIAKEKKWSIYDFK